MSLKRIETQFADHIRSIEVAALKMAPEIDRCCHLMAQALRSGQKVLVMGNGGSAADSQHLAAELVGRFMKDRKALPAIALTTDTSILTAVGNDYGFEEIFKRQVEALASPGDVVIGISTSGASKNVFQALIAANQLGCVTVGLLGRGGGSIGKIAQVDLTVPLQETPRIQEAHLLVIHILCNVVETMLFP